MSQDDPLKQFTKQYHKTPYAAIDPSQPSLSAAGLTGFDPLWLGASKRFPSAEPHHRTRWADFLLFDTTTPPCGEMLISVSLNRLSQITSCSVACSPMEKPLLSIDTRNEAWQSRHILEYLPSLLGVGWGINGISCQGATIGILSRCKLLSCFIIKYCRI